MANENSGTHIPGETETRARDMGWVPPDEWRGDPGKAVDAETFIKRQDNNLDLMRRKLDKATTQIDTLTSKLDTQQAEFTDTVERMEKMSQTALNEQRRRMEAGFNTQMRTAAETGDMDSFDRLEGQKAEELASFDAAKAEADKAPEKKDKAPAKDQGGAPGLTKAEEDVIEGWIVQNPWFERDKAMGAWAEQRHTELLNDKPGLGLSENLEQVTKEAQKRFPEKFGDTASSLDDDDDEGDEDETAPSPYASGSRRASGTGGSGGWRDLPKAAKVQGMKFIEKDGFFLEQGETIEKDLGKAQARYAAKYHETV